ncbi:MAG: tRNA (adenosine(37)-N6)-threonylcarbamoyltransferase complex transferase subunit TsaD [Candidatus Omnitrophica bacterium]|nr:tRNA (adenosine(37)-N6)-threonylcarbamoyltransferase complex transferase subunit TsaD [Candidatus Omnitrophota bacterium]MBU1853513.1 tRNA (adenosine(37)-N6)-threonylcarbamoyltransferase complex transferase subunit TsaD [Candidatus Omnitrophota bacterium]
MFILGIETSCDETAASVVKNGRLVLSNVVSSSLRYHRRFGGVIPEIATRHHVENIDRVIFRSLHEAGLQIEDIDAIAVTQGPGLVGALLSGISCAKAMAYSLDIPLIAVDHLKAHVYSALMQERRVRFPFIGLVISGGHTRLSLVEDFDVFKVLGDTLDDAIGEAYDKVAKILGLGYPGGPVIDRLAKKGNPHAVRFICRPINGSLDFSFSGIKTAVLYYVKDNGSRPVRNRRFSYGARITDHETRNISASFQEAALSVIVKNSIKAMEKYKIKTLVIGGGVSANSRFREMITRESMFRGFKAYFPPIDLCSDNAVMVAGVAYRLYKKGIESGLDITAAL